MTDERSYVDAILSALEAYRLKPSGANQYRCNSPLRSDSDSGAFALTVDPRYGGGGKWFDHVADEGGNFVDLARRLGIAVLPATSLGGHPDGTRDEPKGFRDLAAYAQAHGVTEDVFMRAGWREEAAWCPRAARKRPAVRFETATGTRTRYLDGESPKYLSPKGYQRCWYGLDRACSLAGDGPLILCNGEASVVAAQERGVPAACVTAGEKDLPSDLVDELRAVWSGPIVVALDSDATGRRAAQAIRGTLRGAGFTVRVVDFGGTAGFDLADFCRLHAETSAQALITLPDLEPPDPSDDSGQVTARLAYLETLVATQQQVILQLRGELEDTRRRNRWINDVTAIPELKPAERLTTYSLKREIERLPVEERDQEAWTPVRLGKMAQETGQSKQTVSRHLKKLTACGVIASRVETEMDPELNQPRSVILVRPVQDLNRPETLAIDPSGWGGARKPVVCKEPTCGSTDIVDEVRRVCRSCGTLQDDQTHYHRVNPATFQDGTWDAVAGAAEASQRSTVPHAPPAQAAPGLPDPATSPDPPRSKMERGHLPSIGEVIERLWQRKANLGGAAPAT